MERDDSQDRYVVDAMQAAGDLDAASASSAAEAVLTTEMNLPPDLFPIIAGFLAGSYHFGSLAKLNMSCKLVREVTNSVLWETITLDRRSVAWGEKFYNPCVLEKKDIPWEPELTPLQNRNFTHRVHEQSQYLPDLPFNCRYVRYLMLSDKCQIHFTWIRSIFPKIKAWTQLSVCDSRLPDVLSIHEIIVERPVALMTLIAVVLGTPNPQGPPAGTALSPFGGVDVIHLRNSAYIYGGEESNDSTIDLLVSWPPICDIAGVFFSGECHTTWSHGCHPTTSQRQAARDVATWLALLVPGARMLELQAEGPSTFPPIDAPPAAEQPRDLWENTSPPSNRRSPKRLDVYLSKGHIDHLQQDLPSILQKHPAVWRCPLYITCSSDITGQDMFDLLQQYRACLLASVGKATLKDSPDILLEIQHEMESSHNPHGTLSARWKDDRTDLKALVVKVERCNLRSDSDVLHI